MNIKANSIPGLSLTTVILNGNATMYTRALLTDSLSINSIEIVVPNIEENRYTIQLQLPLTQTVEKLYVEDSISVLIPEDAVAFIFVLTSREPMIRFIGSLDSTDYYPIPKELQKALFETLNYYLGNFVAEE